MECIEDQSDQPFKATFTTRCSSGLNSWDEDQEKAWLTNKECVSNL